MSVRPGQVARSTSLHVVLIAVSIVMLTPLAYLIVSSFKTQSAFFEWSVIPPVGEGVDAVRQDLTFYNFRSLFTQIPFLRFMMNSFFVAGATVLVQLMFSSLGGWALAKYEFRFKKTIMLIMLATIMIPGEVLLAPLYELIYNFRLMDTHAGLIVPGMVSVFGMFLFRQSMLQIPDELLQAARIDGCSELGIWWRVALPVSRPMIGAFTLIAFMGTWNSFIWPQIILHTTELYTLPIGINQMVGQYKQEYGTLMAGTLLSVIPVAVLFFLLQREFIGGLTSGAVKG
jgi:ABC-type glycerol-3-phosphate transport system permease component